MRKQKRNRGARSDGESSPTDERGSYKSPWLYTTSPGHLGAQQVEGCPWIVNPIRPKKERLKVKALLAERTSQLFGKSYLLLL